MANQPQPQSGQTKQGDTVTGGLVTGLGQQSQPQSGQAQQHSRQQAEQALRQHAQAHGFHLPPGVIAAILQLIEAFAQGGGGAMPQAQAGQQSSP